MRKLIGVMGLMVLVALPSVAQETPAAEIFGGYSYFRPEGGGLNMHGWNASVAVNSNTWFGIVGDISGHYGDIVGTNVNAYFFTAGPRLAFRSERVTAFTQFTLGGVRVSAGGISDTGFAAIIGGGADVQFNDSIAFRIFQADYVYRRISGVGANDFRFSAGIVLRVGSRE